MWIIWPLSPGEGSQSVQVTIWLQNATVLASIQIIGVQHIEGDKHKRRQNEIYRPAKTHYLYRPYSCARATGLAATSSHMVEACGMQQASHKAE